MAVMSIIVLFGLGMALYVGLAQSKSALVVLIVFLPLAWLFVFILAVKKPGERRSALSLLKRFTHQVDLANQQLSSDPKLIDRNVLAAFDKLHGEIKSLLAQKKVRFAQLRQVILRFPYPAAPQQGTRWRPPTLSELGYVIGIGEKYSPNTPLLALYKFSGEGRNKDGLVADTFTIMAASVPLAHAALFAAKVYSPITNYAAANSPPLAAAGPGGMPPQALPKPRAVSGEDNAVGYALSLLGPITLLSTRSLVRNLLAIARLPADTALSTAIPATALRRHLRDLLTDKLEHAEAPLTMARDALRQEPQLLVCAIADASRDLKDSTAEILPALTLLAEILIPDAPASRPALMSLMTEVVVTIQSLRVIPAGQPIVNPGVVLIEARGAETDAGLLERVAHWVLPAVQHSKTTAGRVIVTTHLTEEAFHAQLRSYSDMKPGKHDQAVIDVLEVALNVKKLLLHTSGENRPVKVHELLHSPGKKPVSWLLFSANPALVDLTGSGPPAQHVLWTLSGRALDTGGIDLKIPHTGRWRTLQNTNSITLD